jgi:hypothetical protein
VAADFAGTNFYGWGTSWDGTTLERIGPSIGALHVDGSGGAEIDGVARATAPGDPARYTHVDVDIILAGACNYHILVIPPA